jgi:hypothetical protein
MGFKADIIVFFWSLLDLGSLMWEARMVELRKLISNLEDGEH